MTYKEYADKAKKILEAIKNGNYEEDLEAPNFVDEAEKDGKLYLIVCDMDGCKSSNDPGSGEYTVCGEKFYHQFDIYSSYEYEPESEFFDKAEELEGSPEDIDENVEGLINEIKEAIQDLAPSFSDVDDQAAAYARAMGITDYEEAVWYEDWSDEEEDDLDGEDDDDI